MRIARSLTRIAGLALILLTPASMAFAEEAAAGGGMKVAAIGAGLAIGLAALGGTLGQGKAVGAMLESYGRNPSVGGKLLVPLIVGLAFIESLVILAFIIALRSL